MHKILSAWENIPGIEKQPEYIREYEAVWKKARKIIFSSALSEVHTSNTVLKKRFEKDEIEELKKKEPGNLGIGGAILASHALSLGLMDEIYLFLFPVIIGSGKKWLNNPKHVGLNKMEIRKFGKDVVMLHYRVNYHE